MAVSTQSKDKVDANSGKTNALKQIEVPLTITVRNLAELMEISPI